MRVVSRWNRRKKCHSHDNVCVCACYKAAADANAASTLTKVKTFRPLLHLPAYHLHARSVCAIFSIHERLQRLLPARRCASAVLAMTLCLYDPVSVSVTSRSSIDIYIQFILHQHAARRIDGSGWFSARRLSSIYLTLCYIKTQESTKLYFFLELCPKLWTQKISLQYVDHQNVSSASSSRKVDARA